MPSKEYYDGKLMESNVDLHSHLIHFLKFDNITVHGEHTTKGDVIGHRGNISVPISIKYGSQKNTQVHLPTLKSFVKSMDVPDNIFNTLEKWLGVTSQTQFMSWFENTVPNKLQQKYKRLFATDLPEWKDVVDWFNQNNTKISQLLIQSMNDEKPAEFLVWINKKTFVCQIIDIKKLIIWIQNECKWKTGPKNNGSTLRCEDKNGKPIFHLQMKGSGGFNNEYNHNPQFHIHTSWPSSVLICEIKL